MNQSISHSISPQVNRAPSQSSVVQLPISQTSINQSINQLINQSTDQSISQTLLLILSVETLLFIHCCDSISLGVDSYHYLKESYSQYTFPKQSALTWKQKYQSMYHVQIQTRTNGIVLYEGSPTTTGSPKEFSILEVCFIFHFVLFCERPSDFVSVSIIDFQ